MGVGLIVTQHREAMHEPSILSFIEDQKTFKTYKTYSRCRVRMPMKIFVEELGVVKHICKESLKPYSSTSKTSGLFEAHVHSSIGIQLVEDSLAQV